MELDKQEKVNNGVNYFIVVDRPEGSIFEPWMGIKEGGISNVD